MASLPNALPAARRATHHFGEDCQVGDWVFMKRSNRILSGGELDLWKSALDITDLPEMVFGSSRFTVVNTKTGFCLDYNAFDALLGVWRVADGSGNVTDYGTAVQSASVWSQSRDLSACRELVHNYDWTYTSEYGGTVTKIDVSKVGGGAVDSGEEKGTLPCDSVGPLLMRVVDDMQGVIEPSATEYVPSASAAGFSGGISARAHSMRVNTPGGGGGCGASGSSGSPGTDGRVRIGRRAPASGYSSRAHSGGAAAAGDGIQTVHIPSERAIAVATATRCGAVYDGQRFGAGTGVSLAAAAVGPEKYEARRKEEVDGTVHDVDVGSHAPLPAYLLLHVAEQYTAPLPDLPNMSVASTPRTPHAYQQHQSAAANVTPSAVERVLRGEPSATEGMAGPEPKDGKVIRVGRQRLDRVMSGLLWGGAMGALYTAAGIQPMPSLGFCRAALPPISAEEPLKRVTASPRWLPVGPMVVHDAALEPFRDALDNTVVNERFVDPSVAVDTGPEHALLSREVLVRQDPFVFYGGIVLFQDELGDNGDVSVSVKFRVMPGFFFILLRCFVRVDNVKARAIDHRFSHSFGSSHVVREMTFRECRDPEKLSILVADAGGNENRLIASLEVVKTRTVAFPVGV